MNLEEELVEGVAKVDNFSERRFQRKVDAFNKADQFKSELVSNITSGEQLSIPVPHNIEYDKKKARLGKGTTSLVLTGAYVDSITVFEDHGPIEEDGLTSIEKGNDSEFIFNNDLKYYVRTGLTKGIIGYYVDVRDFIHDLAPYMSNTAIRHTASYDPNNKNKDTYSLDIGGRLQKNRELLKQYPGNEQYKKNIKNLRARKRQHEHLQNVKLKYILEYGNSTSAREGAPGRPYWGELLRKYALADKAEYEENLAYEEAQASLSIEFPDEDESEYEGT